MTVAVIQFPGSNCDRDCVHAVEAVGGAAGLVWHKDAELPADTEGVILPGGFSYGDYLRTGAMAALAPIMGAVRRFVDAGGPVLGICNGFQILCETQILPGALLRNADGRFVCELVELRAAGGGRGLLRDVAPGAVLSLPVAHGDGAFFADDATLDRLFAEGKVALTYTALDDDGHARVNGARRGIAGLIGGPKDNVLGLMPHPERRAEARLGGEDGRALVRAVLGGAR